ncbi:MAG: hypothetical protein BRC32_03240 [Actinobacteria bacterium QS_8_72_14]|jgi:hypothetical protein|nr:MAG: hypothetical protein BRC32_03240 [Actinobacteria bacterium QS_8_72_14]
MSTASTATTLALKEWGAVVHALLAGRQTVLLRKGGIHEKAFSVPDRAGGQAASRDGAAAQPGVVLFPTVAHSHRERVRDEHADLLELGEADVSPDALLLRAGVQLVDVVEVARPAGLPAIADLHIWTHESIQSERLDFRPKHALTVLVVRALALPQPVRLPRTEQHRGCRSWLELDEVWDGVAGTAAVGNARLAEDADRVRAEVG